MTARKREPFAETVDEDYRIVRHTHDVDLAAELMRDEILKGYAEYGCPEESWADIEAGHIHTCTSACRDAIQLGVAEQKWVRIVPCLPGSYGATEGWTFQYQHADKPGRGAFPAVVFR